MQYKYATKPTDYSDFSSGRVLYSQPGHPAFPVRLASEIFQRCLAHRERIYEDSSPCTLYDPCCGAAYHLSVLAYLHGEHIRELIASDIDEKAVRLARQNLGLLFMDGLEQRIRELSEMFEAYGKISHQEALRSASALKEKLNAWREIRPLKTQVFQAGAADRNEISKHIKPNCVDLVFTDVPYGRHSAWRDTEFNETSNPLTSMLDALLDVLSPSSIVAIASDKQQKAVHERFQRIEHFQVGKRRIVILRPI
jgi:methylase of polypeptide subunit release factors